MVEEHLSESNPQLAHTLATLEAGIEINPPPVPPEDNFEPGKALGIQACIGTAWWLATFMLYIKNDFTLDPDLTALNGGTIFPIGWFWERISEPNGIYTWFALSLLFNFLFYGLISAIEFIAWVLYLNGEFYFAAFWFSTIGYWGSIFLLPLPWIFAAVYINDTLEGIIKDFPGNWAVLVMVMTLLMWIAFATMHIVYVPDFLAHVAALPKPPCRCDLPQVEPAKETATEEEKAAIKAAIEEREALCLIQCPPKKGDCPLAKGED